MSLGNDLRYAVRMMKKRPGFSALAVLIVAVGVGANSAVFSLVDAVLLSPLPFPEPSELTLLSSRDRSRGAVGSVSYPDYVDWSEQAKSFQAMAAFQEDSFIISGDDGAERVRGELVSPEYLSMLGADPIRGRGFEDDEPAPVVILNQALVERRFGGVDGVVGQTIAVNDESFTVVGVVSSEFEGFTGQARLWNG